MKIANQFFPNGTKPFLLCMWHSKGCRYQSIYSTNWTVCWDSMEKDGSSRRKIQHGNPLEPFLVLSFWSFLSLCLCFKAFMKLPEIVHLSWSYLCQTTRAKWTLKISRWPNPTGLNFRAKNEHYNSCHFRQENWKIWKIRHAIKRQMMIFGVKIQIWSDCWFWFTFTVNDVLK